MKFGLVLAAIALLASAGLAYAALDVNPRAAVEYYPGHTHEGETTIGAPSHSGGTDKWGCHNASRPYHCH